MKVGLFQPWSLTEEWATFFYLPSYGLLRLGGLFPETRVFNGTVMGRDAVLDILDGEQFDLVGVSAQTANRHPAREILTRAKAGGAKTVVGGHHPTAHPHFFDHSYVDHIVRGHGERWWKAILAGDDVPRITPLEYGDHPDLYPPADWTQTVPDPLADPAYNPLYTPLHVATSYGCSGNCLYCISRLMHGGRIKRRDPGLVASELAPLYERGARRFYFIDECFGGDLAHALAICKMVLAEFPDLMWSTFGRVDYLTETLIAVMADAGCRALIIGFESGDQEMLRRLNKGYVKVDRFADVVQWCRDNDVVISCQTMDRLPYQTDDHERLTQRFLDANGLHKQSLGHTIVMPGMPLYDLCVEAGLLDDTFWEGPDLYYPYQGGLVWEEAE